VILTKVTGLPGAVLSDGTRPLAVRLSAAPAPGTPRPAISPAVAGQWSDRGTEEVFTPASTLLPCTSYTLTVPAATSAAAQLPLGHAHHARVRVACPSPLALQEALARLGYLPYRLRPRFAGINVGGRMSRTLAARHAFAPPAGSFAPTVREVPPLAAGERDGTTVGALMVYQQAHGLVPSGVADARAWASLIASETNDRRDPRPYTWVSVSESMPETLAVHRSGGVAVSSPTNTGVAGAQTPHGVFPIFARYTSTTMVGTNPDGTHYDDAGVPWVNYFNGGDAVHGFPRASYGSPQSNGCVELPISTAERVYRLLELGDVVVVS
jgi:L,D-transpeptidase catalytic domain